MKRLLPALLFCAAQPAHAQLPSPDPDDGAIKLPPGFRATVFADNLGRLRFLTIAPSGDVYVKTRDGWLYHSTNKAVLRYKMSPRELVPGGEPETIVQGLPDERQHNSKTFAFDDQGRLYVEVGSPSNSYGGENDRKLGAKGSDPTEFLKTHGGFWRFDASRKNQTQADGYHYATGLRHVLPVAWNNVSKKLFVVMHGRDVLNVVDPAHYTVDDNAELPAEAGKYPDPLIAFPAHWAPMQMAFYNATQFPAKYRGGAFQAFHGSWNRAPKPQKGYNVVYIPFGAKGMPRGSYEVFAEGFAGAAEIANPNDARFRPNGLGVGPDGSLYASDSQKGRVWRIFYVGEKK